ncbi:FAD:protein FMN transferase [Microbacterium sp. NPDC076768]|uniref:FAD:protein FMN transferase n=1 Tax=Microbacterium sp. NPDC076768 TaxID=3154858 RepID=UPI003424E9B3
MASWRFEAIGTLWEIETTDTLSEVMRDAVSATIAEFDRTWSRFREDSEVARLGRSGGRIVSADAAPMLDLYADLTSATQGGVNPLIADSLSALGYDADYSLVARPPVQAPSGWDEQLSWTETGVSASSASMLDIGALGKGRLIDLVMQVLADLPGDVVVDAGGDIRLRGAGVRIALEHPFDSRKAIGVIEARDQALCASAINRRAWGEGLHHVLDGRTGLPVRTWAATWAVAPEAMRADAAATALFFDGGAQLANEWEVDWVRMSTDGRVEYSANCPAELFLTGGNTRPAPER